MKSAIFWGTEKNYYRKEPVVCECGDEDKAIAEMIENYIANADITSPEYVLGVWDPLTWIECDDEEIKNITIDKIPDNRCEILYTLYFFLYYSPDAKKMKVSIDYIRETDKIINVCTGWGDNNLKKISFRIESGTIKPLTNIGKKTQNKFIKAKLMKYIIENLFKPGEFWQYLQKRYNIDCLIIPSPIHWVIIGDKIVISPDNLPVIRLTNDGETKIVTYRIDSGLIDGLKIIANNNNKSVTDIFKLALTC